MIYDAYEEDLAYVHHEGFAGHARGITPEVIRILRHRGIRKGRIVELGSGSGITARLLTDAGFDVVGFELSRAMVRLARRTAPKAKFEVRSFLDSELPRCRAILALGEVLNYRFDPRNDRQARRRLFRRIYAALESGGLFLFDVAIPHHGATPPTVGAIGEDWSVVCTRELIENGHALVRRIATFRKRGATYRRTDETHRVELLDGAELAADLRKIGFRARVTRRLGRIKLNDRVVAVIARKV